MVRFLFNNDTLLVIDKEKDNLWGISIDIIALILVPFAIFIIGYLIQTWRENNKENNRIKLLEKYILFQFEELVMDIEKGVVNIKLFVEKINSSLQQNLEFKTFPELHYKNIINIIQTDKYMVFISGKKDEDLKKISLFDSLETKLYGIEQYHISLNDQFQYYMDNMNKYRKEFGSNIQSIERTKQKLIQYNKINGILRSSDNFLREYDLVFFEWSKKGLINDVNHLMENLVNPMHDLCNKNYYDLRSYEVMNCIINCKDSYNNMIGLRNFFLKQLDEIILKFELYIVEFKEELTYFKKLKNKRIRL